MKYFFTEKELALLKGLSFSFDPSKDLSDKEEDLVLEALMDHSGFGTPESDAYEDVYTHMADQAQRIDTV